MSTVGLCAVQRAYLELRERGDEDGILALTELINDHSISTRVAAKTARDQLDVVVSHNNFTSHRGETCSACNNVREEGNDPSRPKVKRGAHAPKFGKAKKQSPEQSAAQASRAKARVDYLEDGGVVLKDVPLYTPLLLDDDLSPLLIQFGLDPNNFEVLRDTFSMWMQSASDGDGGRDVVYLYSARFRKVGSVDPTLSNAEQLKKWRSVFTKIGTPAKPTFKASKGKPGTYTLWPSDLQLGKTGTAKSVENFCTGIREGLTEAARLVDAGEPIEGIHIGWGGDETEGVSNNYANQPYIIELNQSDQLELDFDLRTWALKEALQLGLPLSASSVVSNHGEWTRNGGKDVLTTKSDNSSTFIAKLIRKNFPQIDWTIGSEKDDLPGIVLELSGTKVYSSHGHIEKGRGGSTELRTKNAIEKQILGDVHSHKRLGDVRLYVMAHYHHHYLIEDRGYTILGLPALEDDESSVYMATQYGVWSPSGLVGAVVGDFDLRPYRNLNVFGKVHEKTPFMSSRDALGIAI
jgi:hypothetical protein